MSIDPDDALAADALITPYLAAETVTDWQQIAEAPEAQVRKALRAAVEMLRAVPAGIAASTADVAGRVVVLRADPVVLDTIDPALFQQIADALNSAGAIVVLVVPSMMTMETLDPEQMRAAGWVPATGPTCPHCGIEVRPDGTGVDGSTTCPSRDPGETHGTPVPRPRPS